MEIQIHACSIQCVCSFLGRHWGCAGRDQVPSIYTWAGLWRRAAFFQSYIPSFFFFLLFFILEFIVLWDLRPRGHLRGLTVSFLTSCHMTCLTLSQWKWLSYQSTTHWAWCIEGDRVARCISTPMTWEEILGLFHENLVLFPVPWSGPWDYLFWHLNCSFNEAEGKERPRSEGLIIPLAGEPSYWHESSLGLAGHRY